MNAGTVFVILLLAYVFIAIRYYVFRLPNDETIYIEDQQVESIRNDGKLTIYEKPPKNVKSGSILEEIRLHRCFYPRIFHCKAPKDMEIQILVFSPKETQFLNSNSINITKLTQTSPINVVEPNLKLYPEFKKAQYAEIPIVGQQSFMIPKGWWIFIDSPALLTTETF
tara:strand:+ start:8168 stop:8671 length:504 start_codon:yes stop_codon:yes gene_type:complete